MRFKIENNIITSCSTKFLVGSKIINRKIRKNDLLIINNYTKYRTDRIAVCEYVYKNTVAISSYSKILKIPLDEIIGIIPSRDTIEECVKIVNRDIDLYRINISKFYMLNYIKKNYPDEIEKIKLDIVLCDHCHNRYYDKFVMFNNHLEEWCNECYNEVFIKCKKCGRAFLKSENQLKDELCIKCRTNLFLLPYHSKNTPELKFYKTDNDNDNLYMGVELEVGLGGKDDWKIANALSYVVKDDNKGFIYAESDNSIDNGFECITQPATIQYHLSIKNRYIDMFNYLQKNGYTSSNTNTCGMHIHINRTFFDSDKEIENLTKIIYFFQKFEYELFLWSRRYKNYIDKYAKSINYEAKDFIKLSNKSKKQKFRKYMINLVNPNTIEFRFFKGTLNIDTFFANLEFIHTLMYYIKYNDIETIQKTQFNDLLYTSELKKYWDKVIQSQTQRDF